MCTCSSSPHSSNPEISSQPQSSPSRSICSWWEPLSSLEGSTNLQHQVLPLVHTPDPQDSRPWSIKPHLLFLLKLDTQSTGCICWWRDLIKGIEIASQQTTLENATITIELVSGFSSSKSLVVWPMPSLAKCYHVYNRFFLPKPDFSKFIWIFSSRKHFKNNISHILNPHFTKWIPLNPAHQDLSNSTKGTFKFLRKFQLWFNLIFIEKIIQYPRTFAPQVLTSWNQAHAPLLEGFPKTPRTWSEASEFGGSHI